MRRSQLLVALLLALAAAPATAQEVHRCESADGRVGYASGACPPGSVTVRTLAPAGTPSPAEQHAARQRGQQDARSAAALERARQVDEERAAREQARRLTAAKQQETHCRRLQTSLRHAQEDLAAARSNKRREMQRRLARAEDAYRDDCPPTGN